MKANKKHKEKFIKTYLVDGVYVEYYSDGNGEHTFTIPLLRSAKLNEGEESFNQRKKLFKPITDAFYNKVISK